MNIIKKILIAIIAFAAFIATTEFLILPPVLKHVMTTTLSEVAS